MGPLFGNRVFVGVIHTGLGQALNLTTDILRRGKDLLRETACEYGGTVGVVQL
jgi:hypothetical protein